MELVTKILTGSKKSLKHSFLIDEFLDELLSPFTKLHSMLKDYTSSDRQFFKALVAKSCLENAIE